MTEHMALISWIMVSVYPCPKAEHASSVSPMVSLVWITPLPSFGRSIPVLVPKLNVLCVLRKLSFPIFAAICIIPSLQELAITSESASVPWASGHTAHLINVVAPSAPKDCPPSQTKLSVSEMAPISRAELITMGFTTDPGSYASVTQKLLHIPFRASTVSSSFMAAISLSE